MTMVILAAALAIDIGRVRMLRRDLQSVADLSALDASRFLDARPARNQLSTIRGAAMRAAARNRWTLPATDVHLVKRSGDDWTRIDAGTGVPDGVEVVARGAVAYRFQPGQGETERHAVASRPSAAGLEIGTYAAAIDTAGKAAIWSNVFDLLVGGGSPHVSLDAVAWSGLANADVSLGALRAAAGSGSVDQFLSASAGLGSQLQIVANALTASGNATAAASVSLLRSQLNASAATVSVRMGDLLVVDGASPEAFSSARVNALDLVRGAVLLARDGGQLNGTVSSGVSGIVDPTLSVHIVEPPRIVFGPVGVTASTGQVSVGLDLGLRVAFLTVPVTLGIDAATGTATLKEVGCDAALVPVSGAATASTNVAGVTLRVLNLPVAFAVTGVSPTDLSFASPFTWAHRQRVGATSFGLATAVGNGLSPLGGLGGLFNSLLAPLEQAVVSPILQALGVTLAGADVAVLGPTCGTIRLSV